MTIKQLITDNQLTGTAAEVARLLNTPSVAKTHSVEVGYRGITLTYGPTFAGTVLAKLDAAGASNPLLKATYTAICTTGIDFAADVTQGLLDSLSGVLFDADETAKLKAIGRYQISLCENAGLNEATEANVQSALDEIAAENAAGVHSQLTAEIINEVLNAHTFASMDALKAAVAAWEG